MGFFAYSCNRAFVRSGLMFNEVWFIPVHPKAVGWGYGQVSVLFNTRHVFMDLALCTGEQSCWNRRESSSN